MMSRKDYIRFAAALKAERGPNFDSPYASLTDWERGAYDAWSTLVLSMADVLAGDNPAFSRTRFLEATGMRGCS